MYMISSGEIFDTESYLMIPHHTKILYSIIFFFSAVSRVYLNGAASTEPPQRSAPGWKSNSSSPNSTRPSNQRDDT